MPEVVVVFAGKSDGGFIVTGETTGAVGCVGLAGGVGAVAN
ncbi:MAG: hypothetical protein P4N59_19765 [Negativicutes bacterium]|nr:hypothetical protein [Negativicutes bacterium]